MPVTGSSVSFGIQDILTRIIPGSFFILAVVGRDILLSTDALQGNVTLILITFSILSLLIGETIDFIRQVIYPVPAEFRRFLDEHHEEDIQLGIFDRYLQKIPFFPQESSSVGTVTQDEFWSVFHPQFNIDPKFKKASDIYSILMSYMGPRLSPKGQRLRALQNFVSNMALSSFGASAIVGFAAILEISSNTDFTGSGAWFFFVSIVSLMVLYLLSTVFRYNETVFIEKLLVEYYIDRVESGGEIQPEIAVEDLEQDSEVDSEQKRVLEEPSE